MHLTGCCSVLVETLITPYNIAPMQDLSDNEGRRLFEEVLLGELRAIRRMVSDLPTTRRDFSALRKDVAELKADMKVVRAAVTGSEQTELTNIRMV